MQFVLRPPGGAVFSLGIRTTKAFASSLCWKTFLIFSKKILCHLHQIHVAHMKLLAQETSWGPHCFLSGCNVELSEEAWYRTGYQHFHYHFSDDWWRWNKVTHKNTGCVSGFAFRVCFLRSAHLNSSYVITKHEGLFQFSRSQRTLLMCTSNPLNFWTLSTLQPLRFPIMVCLFTAAAFFINHTAINWQLKYYVSLRSYQHFHFFSHFIIKSHIC